MIHSEFLDRIALLADDTLPAAEMPAVFRHLSECDACRSQYLMMLRVSRAVRQTDDDNVPQSADAKFGILGGAPAARPASSSVLLSVGAVLMMLVMAYVFGSAQETQLLVQYRSAMPSSMNSSSTR